jgi:hypothetical protein
LPRSPRAADCNESTPGLQFPEGGIQGEGPRRSSASQLL